MALTINTNIASLNTQNNLSKSQGALGKSMQRLSSGLRINSAKDDAAGLAISSRMTSQIRGLNQASRNANDGISLAQTAEGALQESENIFQRMRELAVQSANDTNSASDRQALNAEAQQLLSEANRIAETTKFNGKGILDGSFSSAQFQVGAEANQVITFGISGAKTSDLGSYRATNVTATTSTAFNGADLTINGVKVAASVADTSEAGTTAGSAKAKATAINSISAETGVTATASTSVTGVSPVAGIGLNNGDLKINGVAVGSIAAAASRVTQANNVVSEINKIANQTGVSATADQSSGAITLAASDGRDIKLEAGNAASAQVVTNIFNATGLDAATEANPSGHNTRDITFTNTTFVAALTGGSATELAAGSTLTIDSVVYEFYNSATTYSGSNVGVGVALNGDETEAASALSGKINEQRALGNTTVSASAAVGVVSLTNDLFGNEAISVAESGDGDNIIAAGAETTATDAAGATAKTTQGTLTLNSAENFALGGDSGQLASAGFTNSSTSLTKLSSVDISSVSGANDAISVIDGALNQVASIRGDLGAVQNRFESTIANLQSVSENLSAARGRILDADIAQESAAMTKNNILQQAGVSILAQANQLPQLALSLLG